MIERIGSWLAGLGVQLLAWFDAQSAGVQFLIVLAIALLVVAATHLDDLKREREWRLFRLWLEARRRAGVLWLPRGMR